MMNDDSWDPPTRPPQRIVCAALRHANGSIICGPRHFDQIMHAQAMARPTEDWRRADQGFVDQFGGFLTREEAYEIAEKNGQHRHGSGTIDSAGHSAGSSYCLDCGESFSW